MWWYKHLLHSNNSTTLITNVFLKIKNATRQRGYGIEKGVWWGADVMFLDDPRLQKSVRTPPIHGQLMQLDCIFKKTRLKWRFRKAALRLLKNQRRPANRGSQQKGAMTKLHFWCTTTNHHNHTGVEKAWSKSAPDAGLNGPLFWFHRTLLAMHSMTIDRQRTLSDRLVLLLYSMVI